MISNLIAFAFLVLPVAAGVGPIPLKGRITKQGAPAGQVVVEVIQLPEGKVLLTGRTGADGHYRMDFKKSWAGSSIYAVRATLSDGRSEIKKQSEGNSAIEELVMDFAFN